MLIAFAAEQKLDEGSGGALQTLWLQPRFSPTIPAPHSHCSAHPALPPPCQLRPRTEGKKKKRKKKESFWKSFYRLLQLLEETVPVVVNSKAMQTLSLVWYNICADISSGSLNSINSQIWREKAVCNCLKRRQINDRLYEKLCIASVCAITRMLIRFWTKSCVCKNMHLSTITCCRF